MSKQIEAMKQALEALEHAIPHKKRADYDGNPESARQFHNKAITDLREALMSGTDGAEQPAQQEPICPSCGNNRQVWTNQLSGKKACHRAFCNVDAPIPQPPAQPLTPEWYARWIRNNYQDHPNIATLCDEMTKAAHGITKGN